MWVMLNDAFVSIVEKDCGRGEVLVRARRKGDIEKLFNGAKATHTPGGDYLYRAAIPRKLVARVLGREVARINYDNFKDSVGDPMLHDAYLQCWVAMERIQPKPRARRQARIKL